MVNYLAKMGCLATLFVYLTGFQTQDQLGQASTEFTKHIAKCLEASGVWSGRAGAGTGTTADTGTPTGEAEPLRFTDDWKQEDCYQKQSSFRRRKEDEELMDFTPAKIKKDGNELKNYVVMLTAEWCYWCKKMKPIMNSLEHQDYIVYVFDVDEKGHEDFAKKYKVKAYPQFIIYENGKQKHRTAGATDEAWFTKRMKKRKDQESSDNPYDEFK